MAVFNLDSLKMLTPADLQQYIFAHDIDAELITDIGDTPTVPAAAAALGVSADEIIKTLLFYIKGGPHIVITNGVKHVPVRPLAAHFGVGRRQIKLAKAQQVLEVTGYPAGGVPPFGFTTELPVLLDRPLLRWEIIYGGGGDDRTMLKMRADELLRVTDATLVELT